MKSIKKSSLFGIPRWLYLGLMVIFIILIIFISRFKGSRASVQDPVLDHTSNLPEVIEENIFPAREKVEREYTHRLSIGGEVIKVVLADDTNERTVGLSNYTELYQDEGMLFVFDTPDYYSFWMRKMDFPIDIIWINENKEVIYIKENADPALFPESYKTDTKALYTLEVVSGFVDDHEVGIGDLVDWVLM